MSRQWRERVEQMHQERLDGQAQLAKAIDGIGDNLVGGLMVGFGLLLAVGSAVAVAAKAKTFTDEIDLLTKKIRLLDLVAEEEERRPSLTFGHIISFLVMMHNWDREEAVQMMDDYIAMGVFERFCVGKSTKLRLNFERMEETVAPLRYQLREAIDRMYDWGEDYLSRVGDTTNLRKVQDARRMFWQRVLEYNSASQDSSEL